MRLLLLPVLLFYLPCLAAQAERDLQLTHSFENVALLDAITHLEKLYDLRFSFPRAPVEQAVVDCQFKRAGWAEVKQCLFAAHNLEASWLKNGYVTLSPIPPQTPQEWSLCLTVLGTDNSPLPFATVAVTATGLGHNSDENGRMAASFTALTTDSLEVQYLGYEPQRWALGDLLRTNCPTLHLQPAAFELASVTVEEYLADGISATPDGRQVTFDVDQTPPLPGFAGTEVYRMLSLLPGINNGGETAGNLNIRGGSRDQNLVLWDGIPIYTSGHYFSMISNFNAELIDEIDVWRGPADASLGGRVAGVININTDREVVNKWEAGADLSLLGANLHAKIPLVEGKSDLHLAFNGSINEFLPGPTYQSYRQQVYQGDAFDLILQAEDGPLEKTESFDFTEFNGRWQYNFSQRHRLTLSGFSQRDDFSYRISVPRDNINRSYAEVVSTRNAGLSLNYEQDFTGGRRLKVQLATTEFRNGGGTSYQEQEDEDAEQRRSKINETSLRLHYDFKQGTVGQFKVGLQAQRYDYDFGFGFLSTVADSSGSNVITETNVPANALFGTYVFSPKQSPFRAELGLRVQYYGPTNAVFAEPRIAGSYQLNDTWLLKAGYGENHQFPKEIIFLNPQRVSATIPLWALANGEEVPVLRSREGSFGISGQPGSWFVELELYQKWVNGLSTFGSNVQRDGIVNGNSLASGLDLLVKKRWKKWRTWAIYSLSKTEWRFPFRDNPFRPGDETAYFSADNDRRHQLRLVNTYRHRNWAFSLGWRIHSGSRYTLPDRIQVTDRRGDRTPVARLINQANNAATLPAFHRLDFSVFYDLGSRTNRGVKTTVGLSLLNVYGQENILERQHFLRRKVENGDTSFEIERLDRIGLGITPNLRVRLAFE